MIELQGRLTFVALTRREDKDYSRFLGSGQVGRVVVPEIEIQFDADAVPNELTAELREPGTCWLPAWYRVRVLIEEISQREGER